MSNFTRYFAIPILVAVLTSVFSVSGFAATFSVINTSASGVGSLRQAILDANSQPGLDTVIFNVNGGGAQTIMPGDLPRITDAVILDAATQPGYSGLPLIQLTGPGFSGITYGITIDAGNTVVRGFVINNFNSGGIGVFTNGGNVIEGNFIGTNTAGDIMQPNFGDGIRIFNSSNNVIGGNTAAKRNLISGNSGAGIFVNGTLASNNIIQGNYVGTNLSGTINNLRETRNQREGICLCSSNGGFELINNLIGGSQPGEGNLISANRFDEIRVGGNASGNMIKGNRIGTNAAGTAQLHQSGNGGDGIKLDGGANNVIGGSEPGAGNLISGQTFGPSLGGSGIHINRGSGHVIKGNLIGTDLTGTVPITNTEHGIKVFEYVQNLVIGGPEPGAGNLIAFNTRAGIIISTVSSPAVATRGNSIRGNRIHSNGELGIDLATNIGTGVTPNDDCDLDSGNDAVNDLQNYPVLTQVITDGVAVAVFGTLNSRPNLSFSVDFYANPVADPSGFGEGRSYIGSIQVSTSDNCLATFFGVLSYSGSPGFITATATDAEGNTSEFSQAIAAVPGTIPAVNAPFDFDGDGKTDISIFRPGPGEWWYLRSSDGTNRAFQFGQGTDKLAPADYTGDGKADVGFWRPATGEWFILRSEDFSFYSFPFGTNGDIPVPADFDGDGKADPAVFRPSSATWFILNSSGGTTIQTFGANGDRPVPADYDGDSKADLAIFRPSDGTWWLNRSQAGIIVLNFGTTTDKTVQGDYTGDGKADVAFFRPSSGEWFISRSEDFSFYSFPFGAAGDIPAPGDYDGDGKMDPTVFRPSNSTWYKLQSTSGFEAITFGSTGDIPVPSAFVR